MNTPVQSLIQRLRDRGQYETLSVYSELFETALKQERENLIKVENLAGAASLVVDLGYDSEILKKALNSYYGTEPKNPEAQKG